MASVAMEFVGTWEELQRHAGSLKGRQLRVTVLDEKNTEQPDTLTRKAFLKLPMAERRRILENQAAQLAEHYAENRTPADEFEGDLIDY